MGLVKGCFWNPSESFAYLYCLMASLGFSLKFQILNGMQQPTYFGHPLLESMPPYLHLILKSRPLLSDPQALSVPDFSTSIPHLNAWTLPGSSHSMNKLGNPEHYSRLTYLFASCCCTSLNKALRKRLAFSQGPADIFPHTTPSGGYPLASAPLGLPMTIWVFLEQPSATSWDLAPRAENLVRTLVSDFHLYFWYLLSPIIHWNWKM